MGEGGVEGLKGVDGRIWLEALGKGLERQKARYGSGFWAGLESSELGGPPPPPWARRPSPPSVGVSPLPARRPSQSRGWRGAPRCVPMAETVLALGGERLCSCGGGAGFWGNEGGGGSGWCENVLQTKGGGVLLLQLFLKTSPTQKVGREGRKRGIGRTSLSLGRGRDLTAGTPNPCSDFF